MGVSLSDMSNFSVRGSINEELAEEAERWLDRNIDLTVDRVASSDMAMLNLDPGKYNKSYPTRFVEVVGEEMLPKGYTTGVGLSDVKLVDSSIAQLRDHGIELTKEQEENAKRSLGLEVTEGVAGFVPVMVELAVLNKVVGAAKVVTGVGEMIGTLKSGNKIQRGLAVLMDATIEEGTMQATGKFDTGTGFGFSIAGKGLSKLGLDKLPFKFKGELARLNKSADMLWSNGIKGVTATEFAGNVEAAIADLEGGETMKNYLDQNYKDLSQVGRRALVNMFVFQMIGGGELVGKGRGGFNIRRMEEARNELQRKGHSEEASEIDNYINHYYEGKKGKTKNASYNDLREAVFENLRTNKESTLIVESMDKVPEQFRDRVEEVPAVEGEVDVTFLGIPTGKKKKVDGKTSYSYKVSGKEMADLFFERKGNKSDKDFEGEYNQKRYEDKEQDQKEEGTTEPTETGVVKVTKEPEVFTTPTEKKYASVNRNDGKGEVTLSRADYETEIARQFTESREVPTPKEPVAKEQLALDEGTPKAAPKEDAPVEEKPKYDHPQLGESGKDSKGYMDYSMSGLKESDIEFGTAYDQQRSTAETTVKSNEWSGSGVIQDRVENTGDILRVELSSRGDKPDPRYIQQKIDILRNWVKRNNKIPLNSIPKEIKTKEDFDKSDLSWTNIKDGFEYLKKFNSGIAEQIKFEYEAISTYTKEQKLAKDAVIDLLNNNIKDFEVKLDQLQEVVNRRKKDGKIEIVKSVELGKAPTIKPKDASKAEQPPAAQERTSDNKKLILSELLQRKGQLERKQDKVRNNKDFKELQSEIDAIDAKIAEIDKLKEAADAPKTERLTKEAEVKEEVVKEDPGSSEDIAKNKEIDSEIKRLNEEIESHDMRIEDNVEEHC